MRAQVCKGQTQGKSDDRVERRGASPASARRVTVYCTERRPGAVTKAGGSQGIRVFKRLAPCKPPVCRILARSSSLSAHAMPPILQVALRIPFSAAHLRTAKHAAMAAQRTASLHAAASFRQRCPRDRPQVLGGGLPCLGPPASGLLVWGVSEPTGKWTHPCFARGSRGDGNSSLDTRCLLAREPRLQGSMGIGMGSQDMARLAGVGQHFNLPGRASEQVRRQRLSLCPPPPRCRSWPTMDNAYSLPMRCGIARHQMSPNVLHGDYGV